MNPVDVCSKIILLLKHLLRHDEKMSEDEVGLFESLIIINLRK